MSGTKAHQAREMMAGVRPARAEQRKPPGATSAAAARSLTLTSLVVPSTAGSSQQRPAKCALCYTPPVEVYVFGSNAPCVCLFGG